MPKKNVERPAALLEAAVQRIREGQFVQARLLCEQILQLAPRNPDALHLLGVVALQEGNHAAALENLREAAAARPRDPAFQINLAYAHLGLNQHDGALAAFQAAARIDPDDPEPQIGIGNCLAMLGRPADAEVALRRLVERHPAYGLGWLNLANALKDQERYEEARASYERATQLMPRHADARCGLGLALHKLSRFEEAERAYRACIATDPAFVPAYVSLAVTLNSLRRHREAETLCRDALAREPTQKNAWPVLGKALVGQGRWNDAVRCYEDAVLAHPNSSEAFGDLGFALAGAAQTRRALIAFDKAYTLGDVSPFVRFFKATTLFSAGRIAEGATEYLGRHERATFAERHPGLPLATRLPVDLEGQLVQLIGEQGIGDELFFLRYAPLLRQRGCQIAYCGHPKIASLLARLAVFDRVSSSFDGAAAAGHRVLVGDLPCLLRESEQATFIRDRASESLPAKDLDWAARIDWHCRVYWPELPPPLALTPLPERVAAIEARLRQMGPPPYIGLTWRAGTGPEGQRGNVWFLYKEIPVETFSAALHGVGGTLVSLQRGPRAGETDRFASAIGRPLFDLSSANEDLEEMLALLAVIDEYVGVSNTNMHLRASVGRTAKVLVPWPAEWRWLASGRDSPWFPGFRIYRQTHDGDWEQVRRLSADMKQS